MHKSENQAVVRGREAWERLKKDLTWEDWMMTGTALSIGRSDCLAQVHANDTNSKLYRNAFSEWLLANGFADMDKAIRSKLFDCMEHRAEIETWRATLGLTERIRLNHPIAVLRRWKAKTVEGLSTGSPPKSRSKQKDEIIAAQEERIDDLERRTSKAPGDQYDLNTTRPAEIARIIGETTTLERVEAIHRQLGLWLKTVKRVAGGRSETKKPKRARVVNNLSAQDARVLELCRDHPEWSIETLASRAGLSASYVREIIVTNEPSGSTEA
jgi:hypothetical protein